MRTLLPENNVCINYNSILKEISLRVSEILGNNLESMFLTGSYARGDAKDNSDLDIWIIVKNIDFDLLNNVGLTLKEISTLNNNVSINPQCLTVDEIQTQFFESWVESPVKILDGVLLHGRDIFKNEVSIDELELIYKKYLTDILMGIRHYITIDKPKEKLTYKRLETYIFKPLLFPLRIERFCKIGHYPISKIDLYNSYTGEVKDIVEYCINKEKFECDIEQNHKDFLRKLHNAVDELIKV